MNPMRLAIACIIGLTASVAVAQDAGSMTFAEARRVIDSGSPDPLSGIWRIGTSDAVIALLPSTHDPHAFDIWLLDSPDMSVIPGCKIGSATPTGATATYDAVISSDGNTRPATHTISRLFKRPQHLVMAIGHDGRMTLKTYKKGKKIALWRLIPYLFRVSISDTDSRPSDIDGATRIYPPCRPVGHTVL